MVEFDICEQEHNVSMNYIRRSWGLGEDLVEDLVGVNTAKLCETGNGSNAIVFSIEDLLMKLSSTGLRPSPRGLPSNNRHIVNHFLNIRNS